jgi:hypothetical protein
MEKKDFVKIKSEKMHGCCTPLKKEIVVDRECILVSESIWRLLVERYRASDEICRYAIQKTPAGILDRSPILPILNICLVLRDEKIRQPKHIIIPRKTRFRDLKVIVREMFSWLKDLTDDDIRLWRI